MKINTQKLLILMTSEVNYQINYKHLEFLWPDLSPSGKRSLIAYLIKKKYLYASSDKTNVSFQITEYGKQVIAHYYQPIFSTSTSQQLGESCLILRSAPSFDQQFLRLKRQLLSNGAVQLSKTAFLLLQQSEKITTLCRERYFSSVIIFSIGKWFVGDHDQLLRESFSFPDLFQSLSGISREINGLTQKETSFSLSNHQSKLNIFSVFDRLFSVLQRLRGIPLSGNLSGESGKELLEKLQPICFS
jgi:hypothetical protein